MCPWYKELKAVLRDWPMARPMGSQDSLAIKELDIDLFTPNQATQESQVGNDDDSEVFDGWHPTPPRNPDPENQEDSDRWLDPNLKSSRASPADSSWEDVSTSLPWRQSITPSLSQSSRKLQRPAAGNDKKKGIVSLDSPDIAPGRDAFGLKALMSQMSTKEERAESHQQVIRAQEQMTNKMTEAMTNMISTNISMEIATKKELASDEIAAKKEMAADDLRYKTRLARGNMVVDLIRAGRSPEEA